MTTSEGIQSDTGEASTLENVAVDRPVIGTPTTELDSSAAAVEREVTVSRSRHRRLPRWQTISDREIKLDRTGRIRVLAGSLVGAGCLLLAQRLHPVDASPFAAPSTAAAWIAFFVGIAGVWLGPGLWLSAVMMRAGVGPAARLATRIGTTLAWYALVGPVVHLLADDARVTSGGVVGVTVVATAAACLGIALGLLRQPAHPLLRVLTAALVGAICAQTALWLALLFFTDGAEHEQIYRLDRPILVGCAVLTAVGALSRPDLPIIRRAKQFRVILVSFAVVAITALALFGVGSIWSPAQRMPSAIGIEQVAAPGGADIAFALTGLGPEGGELINQADFTAFDGAGRPVAISTRLLNGAPGGPPMLLVVLDPASRPQLCEPSAMPFGDTAVAVDSSQYNAPIKLTVRDQVSGTLVQAVLPDVWCLP